MLITLYIPAQITNVMVSRLISFFTSFTFACNYTFLRMFYQYKELSN